MLTLFDSHAHYDDEKFNEDRDELLDEVHKSGVGKVINVASDIKSSYSSIELAKKYDWIYPSVGVHPHDSVLLTDDDADEIIHLTKSDKVVAIGEIGLDYYYDNSPRDIQKYWYEKQIRIASECNLPVIIHDRDAHKDIIDILRKYNGKISGVMHCFSGSREMAEELVKMGFYISFSGSVTFKNARKIVEAAASVPDDRLLIETDCPYLAPVPHRGERNSSLLLEHTARCLSVIRGCSFDEIAGQTYLNACRLFNIS